MLYWSKMRTSKKSHDGEVLGGLQLFQLLQVLHDGSLPGPVTASWSWFIMNLIIIILILLILDCDYDYAVAGGSGGDTAWCEITTSASKSKLQHWLIDFHRLRKSSLTHGFSNPWLCLNTRVVHLPIYGEVPNTTINSTWWVWFSFV